MASGKGDSGTTTEEEETPHVQREQKKGKGATPGSRALWKGDSNEDMQELLTQSMDTDEGAGGDNSQLASAGKIDKRKSVGGLAGLTQAQIADHYKKCIQLSTENKINVKNAFALQMIDYMSMMLKKKDSTMNDFQIASFTLDASTKIYACRVDRVHSDAMKISGRLGLAEGNVGEEEAPQEGQEDDIVAAPKKKPKRHGNKRTVETNKKNLMMDPNELGSAFNARGKVAFAHLDACRDNLDYMLHTLDTNDQMELELYHCESSDPPADDCPEAEWIDVAIPELPDGVEIAPIMSGFEFTNWTPSEDNSELAFNLAPGPDAADEDVDQDDVFGDNGDNGDAYQDNEDLPSDHPGDEDSIAREGKSQGVMDLISFLSTKPNDYSYFDIARLNAGAGPKHWKLLPMLKGKKNDGKPKARRSRKEFDLSFCEIPDKWKETWTGLTGKNKETLKLSDRTTSTWTSDDLEQQLDFQQAIRDEMAHLFMRPHITLVPVAGDEIEELHSDRQEEPDNDGGGFFDNVDVDSDYGDAQETAPTASGFPMTDVVGGFTYDELLTAPGLVFRAQRPSMGMTAKQVDMKKLKSSMWRHLARPSENKEDEEKPKSLTTTFVDVCNKIPSLLPINITRNLSVSLGLVSLLHLANEKTLKITQPGEGIYSNLKIEQD